MPGLSVVISGQDVTHLVRPNLSIVMRHRERTRVSMTVRRACLAGEPVYIYLDGTVIFGGAIDSAVYTSHDPQEDLSVVPPIYDVTATSWEHLLDRRVIGAARYGQVIVPTPGTPDIYARRHGLPYPSPQTPIRFRSSGTLPAPLVEDRDYYVVTGLGVDWLRVSLQPNGDPITITDAGAGTHWLLWRADAVAQHMISTWASGDGIEFDASVQPQAFCPVMAFYAASVSAALNEMCDATRLTWRIDPERRFSMRAVEEQPAPFAIEPLVDDVRILTIERSREDVRNEVWLRIAREHIDYEEEEFPGYANGLYLLAREPALVESVTVDDMPASLALDGSDVEAEFYWAPLDAYVRRNPDAEPVLPEQRVRVRYYAAGDDIVLRGNIPSQQAVSSIESTRGVYAWTGDAPRDWDRLRAAGEAERIVSSYAEPKTVVTYRTTRPGLEASQAQRILLPMHGVDFTARIDEVVASPYLREGTDQGYGLIYTVRAVYGGEVSYQRWFRSVAGQARYLSGGASITTPPAAQPQLVEDAPTVSELTASIDDQIVEGAHRSRYIIGYRSPSPLGDGGARFAGVQIFVEWGGVIRDLGSYAYQEQPGEDGGRAVEITTRWDDPPGDDDEITIYAVSIGAAGRPNQLRRPPAAAPTPSATIPARVSPFSRPPDVRGFVCGTYDEQTQSWSSSATWDTLGDHMRIDWSCRLPNPLLYGGLANWTGVQVWIRRPAAGGGYTLHAATGVMDRSAFVPVAGASSPDDMAIVGRIMIERQHIPSSPETWTLIAVSYDRAGRPRLSAAGEPIGPEAQCQTSSPPDAPPIATVQKVAALTLTPTGSLDPSMNGQNPAYRTRTEGGVTRYYVGVQLRVTPPTNDQNWSHAGIVLRRAQRDELEPIAEYPYTATYPQAYDLEPIWLELPNSQETWRFVAFSVGKNGVRQRPDPNASGTFIDITVSPPGDAQPVTNFVVYVIDDSSAPVHQSKFRFAFNVPSDPTWWYARIEMIETDASGVPLPGRTWSVVAEAPYSPYDQTDWWPRGASTSYWKFRAISVSVTGKPNMYQAPEYQLTLLASSGVNGGKINPSTLHGELGVYLNKLGIAAQGVQRAHLADLIVDAAKLANSAVTAQKIAAAAVGSAAIAVAAIGSAHIQDAAITNAKIADVSVGKLTAGTATFSGDAVFQNSGSVQIIGGGGLLVTPGSIHASGGIYCQSATNGWTITPGLAPTIAPAGSYGQANARVTAPYVRVTNRIEIAYTPETSWQPSGYTVGKIGIYDQNGQWVGWVPIYP